MTDQLYRWVKASEKPLPSPYGTDGKLSVRYKGKADIIKFNGTKWVWDIIGVNVSDKHLEDIEWLDESPTTADASVLKEALEHVAEMWEKNATGGPKINAIAIARKALAQYSTQSHSSIEESGLKEGEEKTRRDIAKIMEDNIDFHPQVNGFVVHGAIDKIIQYFKKP